MCVVQWLCEVVMRNKEQDAVKKREWYLAHREETIARTLAWRKANPDGRRKHRRTARGVVNATGEKRVAPCEFCLRIMTLQQDHSHVTGKARGWLCNRCNLLVAWWEIILKEDAMRRLNNYLDKWS